MEQSLPNITRRSDSELRIRVCARTKVGLHSREIGLSMQILTSETDGCSISLRISKGRLSGFVRNFGNGGDIKLSIKAGKISARVDYLGDVRSFYGILHADGRWNGKLTRQLAEEKMTFLIKGGKTSPRVLSRLSRPLLNDPGVLLSQGKSEASRKAKGRDYQFYIGLKVFPRSEVCGLIKHKSRKNYTRIELIPGGKWNAQGWVKLTGGKFVFSAQAGRCRSRFEGKP